MGIGGMAEVEAEKRRREARLFVDGLADRFSEIDEMARRSRRYGSFEVGEYAHFKAFFLDFIGRVEEFQRLSLLAENALALLRQAGMVTSKSRVELELRFRELQIAMLQRFVATQLRLLKVWDECGRQGGGLPFGSRELFAKAGQVIQSVKDQLLRPRYIELLDEQTIEDAENAERLVRALMKKSPVLPDFAETDPSARDDGDTQPFLPGLSDHVLRRGGW